MPARVNSQSGKGGVAYLLRTHYGVDLPKDRQRQFADVVQRATDEHGGELTPADLYALFRDTYGDRGFEGREGCEGREVDREQAP